jgi:hypothetical protein
MSVIHEGFHATDGWYFERLPEGRVRVSAAVQRCTEVVEFDAATWASIVASVSHRGEDAQTYAAAHDLHYPRVRVQS